MKFWTRGLMQAGFLICGIATAFGQAPSQTAIRPVPKNPTAADFLTPPQQVAIQCAKQMRNDVRMFAKCAGGHLILSVRQQAIIDCSVTSHTKQDFAECSAMVAGIRLSPEQRVLAGCAMKSNGNRNSFITCAGTGLVTRQLTPKQQALVQCASVDSGKTSTFATCSATALLGPRISREQAIAIECAADSNGDAEGFATCTGTKFLALQLNPEQQIAVECVVTSGGVIYATAGCIATRLTGRELEKCAANGWGGNGGCFGDTNDIVGKNGWLARSFDEIAGGPNSVEHNPGLVFGGPNSVFHNPEQLGGGPNSVIRNPAQLVHPVAIGSIGGHRVCLPPC